MLDVPREHTGLHPLKAPGVFDGDQGIGSGYYRGQSETAVGVALVSAKHIEMRLGIFGDQRDRHAGGGFPTANDKAFDGDDTKGQKYCSGKGRASRQG